ncbi:DoxX family protein [Mammaliicoccus sciuri]|uniref:DoxX family protein n=1 Tax=Mammaliicoccus sciuri TaxID=1296 RepID=UPI0034DD8B65
MKLGVLFIRLFLGITFIIHGSQKVFSGFGDPMSMMESLGVPAFIGIILALFELIGGLLIVCGMFINFISSGFIVIMLGALFKVHLKQGYMDSEFVVALLIMSFCMLLSYNWKKTIQFY